jgi:hypothetical protein
VSQPLRTASAKSAFPRTLLTKARPRSRRTRRKSAARLRRRRRLSRRRLGRALVRPASPSEPDPGVRILTSLSGWRPPAARPARPPSPTRPAEARPGRASDRARGDGKLQRSWSFPPRWSRGEKHRTAWDGRNKI